MCRIRNKKGQFEKKPINDGYNKWCNCNHPQLVRSEDNKHQALCLNCFQYWYN